jgi:glycosyltransferase involved in cell wall biosynthesis
MASHLEGFHENITIAPGGVDVFHVAPEPPPAPSGAKQIILATGRLDDSLKGLDVLLAAGDMLSQSRNDFEIHATHWDRTLSKDRFRALGWLTHEETLAQYQRAAIVAVPSIWQEPFGLVAVEAMAHARPVVASKVGGLAEIVRDGETGLHVPPNDPRALAEALGTILDSPARAHALGQAGRLRAETCYHWPRVIEQHYLPLIERLAGKPVHG